MRLISVAILLIVAALIFFGGRAVDLPLWAIVALLVTFVGSGFLSILLLGMKKQPPALKARTKAEEITEMEGLGQIASETYHATRAFHRGIAEGLHYFIELTDGRVLHLDGQYLEEYSGKFPCSEFDLLRHKDEGYIVGLRCRGHKIPVQDTEPPSDYAYPPSDGEIITDRTFEQLIAAR